MATSNEILALFRTLKANYSYALKNQMPEQISDLQILWCDLLKDLDIDVLKAAAIQHVATSKWFPTISELRDGAFDIMNPRQQTAMEAWGEVVRQIRNVGSWGKPKFEDPITGRLVSDIGWINLCHSEMLAADRARFIEAYDVIVKRERQETMELPMVIEVKRRLQAVTKKKLMTES